MNRRNFLGMLSALPFVRGLSAPKLEPAIPAESRETPVEGWPVEFSVDGQVYRAKSFEWHQEMWEDRGGGHGNVIRRGTTGRFDFTLRSIDAVFLPLRIGEEVRLRVIKPIQIEIACQLTMLREDIEVDGRRVTHVEFIADRRDLRA